MARSGEHANDNSADSAEPGQTAPAAEDSPVTESTKSGMAAALERKKLAAQNHGQHLDGSAKVGGATENHKATRTFRRKSG